jgi:hypothetical protein
MRITKVLAIAAAAILASALGPASPRARAEVPTGEPTFTHPLDIDNAYHPFVRNRLRVYELVKGGDDTYAIDVFLSDTRTFLLEDGTEVECAIMEEWAIEDGELAEISTNYFAQADDGTVYYFGETVDNYEDGEVVDHGGSWLVGGPSGDDPPETETAAVPAVFMPADPEVGDVWKPEDLPDAGIEEFDTAEGFERKLRVEAGKFYDVLRVREETPDVGRKWYAPGVGFVRSKEGKEVLELDEIIDSEDDDEMQEELEEVLEDLLDGEDD